MAELTAGRTTVNRLRIRGRAVDRLIAQTRAGQCLEEATAQPASVPPAAILCIRRLVDPRPGVVRVGCSRPLPQWSQAVRSAIDHRARDAVRPARAEVPANADAVVFADRAEMLACLAVDWCTGSLGDRWWWRPLLGDRVDDAAVLKAWLAAPQHIGAAFEETARLGAAARFVARLDRASVSALLTALIVEHDLRPLAAAIERLTVPSVLPEVAQRLEAQRLSPGADEPWRGCVPECATRLLKPDQHRLLGVALTLRRQPWRVRTSEFAGQVGRWSRDVVRSAEAATHEPRHPAVESAPARALSTLALDVHGGDWPQPKIAAAPVTSQVGGVLYLLNVAIALGLYGDFTMPRERGIDLPIWDFVIAVGSYLAPRRFRRDPLWRLLAELAGREARAGRRAPLWVTQSLVPHLRSRIGRALGVARLRHADAVLCVHRAQIVTSPAHLDVFFSLAAHPMAIRLAGLDRDPGWIPAADRIVTFHYD
jgi:hypothetical protein